MSPLENSEPELTEAEIEEEMREVGFEEMRRHWAEYKRLDVSLNTVADRQIDRMRDRHMAPLFGRPALVAIALLGLSALVVPLWIRDSPVMESASLGLRIFMGALAGLNVMFLLEHTLMLIQRYAVWPMGKIMALDLALMLKQRNFRAWLEKTTRGNSFKVALQESGIRDLWDNPSYEILYEQRGDSYEQVKPLTLSERVHGILRDYLGQMDDNRRRHVPGRLMEELRDGKKSVTAFVAQHREKIRANAAGALPHDESLFLLRSLRDDYLDPSSKDLSRLKASILALERGDNASEGSVCAAIWQRDPWVDLTHQEEFFSSASLRGSKLMGRGPKGRLGTFGYLRNPSVSALDFSWKGKRCVRARIGAVTVKGEGENSITGLFVDGVEGSNAIKPRVIHQALEDYARACGFDLLMHNGCVHNQIPRRFVRYAATLGLPLREVEISYMDTSKREYLDAFGLPIEPFEYTSPRGRVLVHVMNVGPKDLVAGLRAPSHRTQIVNSLRRNAIWLFLTEALLFAGILIFQATPSMFAPLAVFAGIGIAVHFWYQFKSVRTAG